MYVSRHVFFGAIFSLFLFLVFPKIEVVEASIVFLSSVLIDVDHYIYYVYKKKDWSLKRAYRWFMETEKKFKHFKGKQMRQFYDSICIFHGIEIIIFLLIWALAFKIFLFIIIGCLFHFFIDWIDLYYRDYDKDKIISLVYSIQRAKNKKFVEEYK